MLKQQEPTLKDIGVYFFQLGLFGFGGAVAILDKIHRELVEKRKWITEAEFKNGVAFTQFTPGPFATLVSTYIGFLKAGVAGATVAWIGFLLAPSLFVLGISIFYVKYGSLFWMQGALYGIGATVIGVISASVYGLIRKTVKTKLLWIITLFAFIIAFTTKQTNFLVLIFAGIINILFNSRKLKKSNFFALQHVANIPFVILPPFLQSSVLLKLFLFFLGAGSLAFGGGLAILPYMQSGAVYQFHWITEKQFVDAAAVAMMTPGPVVITSIFIGFLVAGIWGALISGLGMFLPVYIIAVVLTPFFKKHAENPMFTFFTSGVVAAAMGSIVSSIIFLGKGAVIDIFTVILAIAGFVFTKYVKIPIIALVLIAGILGVLFHG